RAADSARARLALIPLCKAKATPIASAMPERASFTSIVRSDVRLHLGRDDLVRILHGLAALDLVDILHAGGNLAPDGVLTVEETGVLEADEELAVGRIRTLRAGHRRRAARVLAGIEFGGQLLPRAAHAGSGRIAGLGHETFDDTME